MIKRIIFISALALAVFVTVSISFHQSSPDFGNQVFAACDARDVRKECCPIACAVNNSGNDRENALKSCMKSKMTDCKYYHFTNHTMSNTCNCN